MSASADVKEQSEVEGQRKDGALRNREYKDNRKETSITTRRLALQVKLVQSASFVSIYSTYMYIMIHYCCILYSYTCT